MSFPIGWDHHSICLFFLAPKHWRGSDDPPTSSYQRMLESQCSKDGDLICLLREDGQRRTGTYLHDEKLGYPTLTGVIRNTKTINNHQDDIEPVVFAVHPQPLETYFLSHGETVSSTGRLLLKQWRRSERIRRDSEWLSWMDETSFRRQKATVPNVGFHLSNEKDLGSWGYIGDYTTQLYGQ